MFLQIFVSSSEQIGFDITSVSGQKFFFNRTMQFWIVIISDDNEGRHKNIYLAKISNDIGEREESNWNGTTSKKGVQPDL